jgi:hypothetical protein
MNDYMRENKIEPMPPQALASAETAARSAEGPPVSPSTKTARQ